MIVKFSEFIKEDTSATGGAVVSAGMGAVVVAVPSSLSGTTIGPSFSDYGGTVGSGDISVPYNATGGKMMTQSVPMGRNHGSKTGKKSREKKVNLKEIQKAFKNREVKTGEKKVMNYDDFVKNDVNFIKR